MLIQVIIILRYFFYKVQESGISSSKNVTSEPDVHVCMDSESAENVNHVGTEEKQGEELPNAAVLSISGHTDGCYPALDQRDPETAAVPKQTEQPTFSNNQVEPLKQKEIDKGIDEKMNTQVCVL